jgi:dihydrofolate synthase / folylpolyglutamate synthase
MSIEPIAYLLGLEHFGIKFGLENIGALAAALNHPERAFHSIHVAGTNGKGSVTAMIDSALRAAGYRAARYTSPHLLELNERFVIDGRAVDAPALVSAVADVRSHVDSLLHAGTLLAQPTFFEVTTAVAFELFRRAAVDVATLEVGLGGRLDATNIVTPRVTAITSIALEHQQYLGRTVGEIAAEKAGIIKPGVPLVLGETDSDAAAVIESVARSRGAEIVRAWEDVTLDAQVTGESTEMRLRTPAHDYGRMSVGLRGAHQVANALVAVRVLEQLDMQGLSVPSWAIVEGLAAVSWPGRLDLRRLPDGRELLLDAAHNPAGAAALATYLHRFGTRPPLVFAAMRDKDVSEMFRVLLPEVSSLVLTRASNLRTADPEVLAARARNLAPSMRISVEPGLRKALESAWRESNRVLAAGSLFLVGDVLQEIERS